MVVDLFSVSENVCFGPVTRILYLEINDLIIQGEDYEYALPNINKSYIKIIFLSIDLSVVKQ
jgi:hypothetical protein